MTTYRKLNKDSLITSAGLESIPAIDYFYAWREAGDGTPVMDEEFHSLEKCQADADQYCIDTFGKIAECYIVKYFIDDQGVVEQVSETKYWAG